MTDVSFEFERSAIWSEIKLEIIEKYGPAYTKILGATRLKKFYIDGFSGAGGAPFKGTAKRSRAALPAHIE